MEQINPNNQSIYCYPGTSVLINNNDIHDKEELLKLENMLVTYKLSSLIDGAGDFKRDLSINHYLGIHAYLFSELYPFGGKLREEFTNKKNSEIEGEEGIRIYCNPDFIYQMLVEELAKMKKEAVNVKTKKQLVHFLATHYMEIYFIHPFREGNSRTLREFMREYVELMDKHLNLYGDYKIEYSQLDENDRDNFIRATIWNISTDKEKQEKSIPLLESVFDKCVIEYEKGEKTK